MNTFVFAMPVASLSFISYFAAAIHRLYPSKKITITGAKTSSGVLRKYPTATFIEPARWDVATPKHYLCIIAPHTWQQIERSILLEPKFVKELLSQFGSADIGAEGCEQNQYLYFSAELLTVLGVSTKLRRAFAVSPTRSYMNKALASSSSAHQERKRIYEDVLGLSKGSYDAYIDDLCTSLICRKPSP